ncbi:hypothetical protein DFP72DRAFT_842989 [Ephemerocybe angulata]|uniref:Uncharacterized protein n=1 Tax=Ephemerocybe angulata TaxID=980116 RepID=A0A8H6ME60_9AGAR|nr:hypothetical protein DFP72DRAFT_842989 [Tulosesus angulatus]
MALPAVLCSRGRYSYCLAALGRLFQDPGIYPIYDRCTIRTKPPPKAAGARFLSGHLGSKATQIGSPDIWVLRHLEVDLQSGQMDQWILPYTQCLVPWVFKFGDPPPRLPVVQARSINAKFDISAKKREKSRKSRKNWNIWAGSGVRTRTPGAWETWILSGHLGSVLAQIYPDRTPSGGSIIEGYIPGSCCSEPSFSAVCGINAAEELYFG